MKKLTKNSLGFYQKLTEKNISIIPIRETEKSHKPNLSSWAKYKDSIVDDLELLKWYSDNKTVSFGLVTGFGDIEAIDIDSKILPTKKDRDDFISEYLELLENHIDDFYKKVCIAKTQSGGYHILYRTNKVDNNTKIAKPKGHKQALIETRGNGGFVYIYENFAGVQYHEIEHITDEDKKIIWEISRIYNYEEPIVNEKLNKQADTNRLDAWTDYANKNTVLSVCGDEFTIVKRLAQQTIILRNGSDAGKSGHIYDNGHKMFLFSTGTEYPAEQPLNSFDVYTIKYHNGDYSAASKQAYKDGYGDRLEAKITVEPVEETKLIENNFPLDVFPNFFAHYITECNEKLNASIDFMGVATLWLSSVLVGNTFNVKVKNGWIDSSIIWISVIGNAGVGKTPDLKLILKPLMNLNTEEIKRYNKKFKEFQQYEEMEREDKKRHTEIKKPVKKQLLVDDITIEDLVDQSSKNPKGIGVFKDELAGWFKDMNKYRDGSDKERYLSAWSGDSIILNRKTAEDAYVEKPFIPILGGIQPSIFKQFQTEENHSNGFMDRMLFCDPKKVAQYPTDEELDNDLIETYRDTVFHLRNKIDTEYMQEVDGVIEPNVLELTKEAKQEYKRQHCDLIDLMNSDNEIHYYRGMYAKQITYIPRFALLIELMGKLMLDEVPTEITKDSILKAGKLSDYFVNMAKVNKSESINGGKMKDLINKMKGRKVEEVAIALTKNFPQQSKKNIAEALDISRSKLYKCLKNAKV